jgi:hypothetical protein
VFWNLFLRFLEELAKFAEPLANATELLAKAAARRLLTVNCIASSYFFLPHNFASS